MFKDLHLLKRGSIIFLRKDYSLTSWVIRKLIGFKYSHVMIYLGVGKVLEADIGGVQITDFSRYLADVNFFGEVVVNPLSAKFVDLMIKELMRHLEEHYDYSLLFGGALTKITLKCNKNFILRWADHAKSWVCSELIAEGFKQAGLTIRNDNIDPKELYGIITKGKTLC